MSEKLSKPAATTTYSYPTFAKVLIDKYRHDVIQCLNISSQFWKQPGF